LLVKVKFTYVPDRYGHSFQFSGDGSEQKTRQETLTHIPKSLFHPRMILNCAGSLSLTAPGYAGQLMSRVTRK